MVRLSATGGARVVADWREWAVAMGALVFLMSAILAGGVIAAWYAGRRG